MECLRLFVTLGAIAETDIPQTVNTSKAAIPGFTLGKARLTGTERHAQATGDSKGVLGFPVKPKVAFGVSFILMT